MSVSSRKSGPRKCQSANERSEEVSSTTIILSSEETNGMESLTICSDQFTSDSTDNVILIATAPGSSPSTTITLPISQLNGGLEASKVLEVKEKANNKTKNKTKSDSGGISVSKTADKPGTSALAVIGKNGELYFI